MERIEGLNSVDTEALDPDIRQCLHRFSPKEWFNDEIINQYGEMCAQQEYTWIASTWVYPKLVNHEKGIDKFVGAAYNIFICWN